MSLDIFSTREIASGVWFLIIIILVFINLKTRKAAMGVIRIACSKQLLIPFLFMLLYAAFLTYLFSRFIVWQEIYYKDILIWTLFVGVPTCFGAVSSNLEYNYFKKVVIRNLKYTVIIEFLISSYTFNIIIELILIPFITVLTILNEFYNMNEKYKSENKILSAFLGILGFIILGVTLKMAIENYSLFGKIDTLVSFLTPLGLSLLFLPVVYGLAIFSKYQTAFIRMSFKEKKDNKLKNYHRWRIIKACHLSYSRVCWFERNGIHNMYLDMSEKEFDDIIKQVKLI